MSEDDREIAKLYWERARVLRKKGDIDGALSALENVTMLEPEHVGGLALIGEVYITKSNFGAAAPVLARLAASSEAPRQQRLMSGIAAVDLSRRNWACLTRRWKCSRDYTWPGCRRCPCANG